MVERCAGEEAGEVFELEPALRLEIEWSRGESRVAVQPRTEGFEHGVRIGVHHDADELASKTAGRDLGQRTGEHFRKRRQDGHPPMLPGV